ncbi:MAG: hypothetical protein KME07_08840 [Pegethrix bostrychoides GSE-TBD4-15B]|jgi:hypothetical protein|uniref:Cas10/Cmr2 second palm domain-containing protein n=1 Tax=Pegethrix bostrychoides GSE-TBD4-15B TaxID=2839662 RepID=A0A951P9W6_9CYAN|nr:hypothetical protein [Pegethrix bostrychoides GSE-TBD4-15B]
MTIYTATVIDTSGIQPYIFGSNRLRENIGASYLVNQATGAWVKEALGALSDALKKEQSANYDIYIPPERTSEAPPKIHQDPRIVAELIYTGGGNAIAIFHDRTYAIRFIQILSQRVLHEAPGLTLSVAHQDFDWDETGSLFQAVQQLRHKLEYNKPPKAPSAPLLGLSVTAACNSTQLVAIGMSDEFGAPADDTYLISREVQHKITAVPDSNDRLWRQLRTVIPKELPYEFPTDFDNLGRSRGESSYIAIVHADGNSMGNRFEQCGKGKSNMEYVTAIRKLSNSVNHAGVSALRSVTQQLINSIADHDKNGKIISGKLGQFPLNQDEKTGRYYLPFRPLVYGGDDVAFVCDGRLGLELAALYLEAFAQQTDFEGRPFSACAGIAIVKTHYPFARAYALSEALCGSAKTLIRNETKPTQQSALDWHIATSGLLGSIGQVRQREYQSAQQKPLVMRPLWLSHQDEWRTWEGFKHVTEDFVAGEDWKDRKNKVLALREVLRQGGDAIEQFLNVYKLDYLPTFPVQNGLEKTLQKSGWVNEHCGYFDAIEAMDFYLDIAGRNP